MCARTQSIRLKARAIDVRPDLPAWVVRADEGELGSRFNHRCRWLESWPSGQRLSFLSSPSSSQSGRSAHRWRSPHISCFWRVVPLSGGQGALVREDDRDCCSVWSSSPTRCWRYIPASNMPFIASTKTGCRPSSNDCRSSLSVRRGMAFFSVQPVTGEVSERDTARAGRDDRAYVLAFLPAPVCAGIDHIG